MHTVELYRYYFCCCTHVPDFYPCTCPIAAQVVVQAYNALQDSLSDIDHMLLQHKLQQIEKVQ